MARRNTPSRKTSDRRPEDWFPPARPTGSVGTSDLDLKADKVTQVIAGAGLTGGGTLAADRTFNVGAGTGITVNADDVAIDTTAEAERIRDVMGTALVAGTNVTITVNDGADTITIDASGGGSGIADGDYGDITVGGGGTTFTIDNDAVTFAKMQNIATDKLLGRETAGAGDIEEIALSVPLSMASTTLNSAGNLIGRQIITATGAGTYTPTTGTNSIIIEMVGGGGGGGGCGASGANQGSRSSAGGGGAYLRKRLTANFSGAAYSVGTGGNGGTAGANNGTAGGNTTFTDTAGSPTVYTAGGGSAGSGQAAIALTNISIGVTAGGTATNGDINISGGSSGIGAVLVATGGGWTGQGGSSIFSAGAAATRSNSAGSTTGAAATGYGGGGGAGYSQNSSAAAAGGNGSQGILIIWEYS